MSSINHFALLLAEQEGGGGLLGMLFPMLLMFAAFYFVLIRPQNKKRKELEAQINAMKIGDEVVTIGGIHGRVANIKDARVTLKLADNVKVEFTKASVATITKKSSDKEEDAEEKKD